MVPIGPGSTSGVVYHTCASLLCSVAICFLRFIFEGHRGQEQYVLHGLTCALALDLDIPPASRACEPAPVGLQMMDKIVNFEGRSEQKRGQELVLLINNMGSTPPMELYVVAQAAQKYAEEALKV